MNLYTPADAVATYRDAGVKKASLSIWKMLILGILAGAFIAFAGALTNTAVHSLTNVSVIRIVCGLLFPFGLIMVILSGAELFTGNTMMVIAVLEKKAKFASMLRNWLFVYIGNFIGGVLVAIGCAFSGQMNYSSGGLAVYTIKTAVGKCSLAFGDAIVLGIMCNILVCLAVLISVSAKDVPGKVLGAYIPVAVFVLLGFEHSVANMYYVPAGLFALNVPEYAAKAVEAGIDTSMLTWGNFLLRNLLPVTIGNIIGGAGLGAALWACHLRKSASATVSAKEEKIEIS